MTRPAAALALVQRRRGHVKRRSAPAAHGGGFCMRGWSGFDMLCDASFKAGVGEDGCGGVFVVPPHAVRGARLLGFPRVIDFIGRGVG